MKQFFFKKKVNVFLNEINFQLKYNPNKNKLN